MYASHILDWLGERGHSEDFEGVEAEKLAKLLHHFYGETRTAEGDTYNHNSLRAMRAAINRHIQQKPHSRTIDIIKDAAFIQANDVFDGYIKDNKRAGKDKTKNKDAFSDADWKKLHDSDELSTETPTTLQNKVILNILTHFGRRGREGLREMNTKTFSVNISDEGNKYVSHNYNELTKNHQDSGRQTEVNMDTRLMSEQPGDPHCPVHSFEKYIQHLDPTCEHLFPYPLDHVTFMRSGNKWQGRGVWYSTRPLGVNTIGDKVKVLSKKVGLSKVYTNHCVRATVVTRLSRQGVEARKIRKVTMHKNDKSLDHYCSKPTVTEQAEISSLLHNIEPVSNKRPASTISVAPTNAVPVSKKRAAATISVAPTDDNPPTLDQGAGPLISVPPPPSQSAMSSMAQANSNMMSSMFAGAHFHHATININMGHAPGQ